MKTGVYKILNKITGKMYIGYSTNIVSRWYGHKSQLRRNIHKNVYLQGAWNKYGEQNFEFIILEECLKNDLCKKEYFYINQYNSTNRLIGYNIEPGDPNHPVRKPSKLEIENLIKRNSRLIKCEVCGKEINNPNYHKYHGKNCGKIFRHSDETKLKLSLKSTGRVVSQESREKARNSMKGRKFSAEHIAKMIANRTKFKHTAETREKMRNNLNKNIKVYQYDLDGNLIAEYKSITEAHLKVNIAMSTIVNHCNKKVKYNSDLEYRWSYIKYLNNELAVPFRVKMIDPVTELELKLFRTVKEAAEYLKVSPGSIYKCLTNEKQLTAVGYKWVYI